MVCVYRSADVDWLIALARRQLILLTVFMSASYLHKIRHLPEPRKSYALGCSCAYYSWEPVFFFLSYLVSYNGWSKSKFIFIITFFHTPLCFTVEIIGLFLLFIFQFFLYFTSSDSILGLNWSTLVSVCSPFFSNIAVLCRFVIQILLFLDFISFLFYTKHFLLLKMIWLWGLWVVSPFTQKAFFFLREESFGNLGGIWIGCLLWFP